MFVYVVNTLFHYVNLTGLHSGFVRASGTLDLTEIVKSGQEYSLPVVPAAIA